MNRFRTLSLATTATTLALVGVGGLVRATDSGLGCPDWPRCHGKWIPPLDYHSLIEYSHRLLASVAVALVATTALLAWRRHRRERHVLVPSIAALGLIVFQALLGAAVVDRELDAGLVTAHFATAMALVAALVTTTVNAFRHAGPETGTDAQLSRLARISAAAAATLLLAGAYVRGSGAGLVFADWPLMGGRPVPATFDRLAAAHFVHRVLALGVAVLVTMLWLRARAVRDRDRGFYAFAAAAAHLTYLQALVGAIQVWTDLSSASQVAHVLLSSLVWAALVATVTLSPRPASERAARRAARGAPAPVAGGQIPAIAAPVATPSVEPASRPSRRDVVRAYWQLTKPRIIVLLLVTTVPAMVLAQRGAPSLWLMLATLFGGTLAAGSANTFNCYLDRDIDSVMRRTRGRPLPSHRVEPGKALAFAVVLATISFVFMSATTNLLAAALAQSAIVFYVLVYTIVLKRSTPQNIVIGGAAGAVPVLVGWAAVTGTVGLGAWIMFAIVFVWTPPHFWALALRYAEDYRAAGVPMMPVVRGTQETTRLIVWYTVALVATSFALWPVERVGAVYLATAGALGALFLRKAAALRRDPSPQAAMRLFAFSISYLALLFGAIALDMLV